MPLFFLILISLVAVGAEILDCEKYCSKTIQTNECVVNPESCKATCNEAQPSSKSVGRPDDGYEFKWLTQGPIFCGDKILYHREISETIGGLTVTNAFYEIDEKTIPTLCESRTVTNYTNPADPGYYNFTCETMDPARLCRSNPEQCKNTLSCHDNTELIFPGYQTPTYIEYSASCVCGDAYYQFTNADCNNQTQCSGKTSGYSQIDSMIGICSTYDGYCPRCKIDKCEDGSAPKIRIGEYNCKECYCPQNTTEEPEGGAAEIAIISSFLLIFALQF